MRSRPYLDFGLLCLLANISSDKMDDTFINKYKERISQNTMLAANGACILWAGCRKKVVGGINSGSYGVISVKFKHGATYKWQVMRVHRLAYMLHVRSEIPRHMHCSHLCHSILCVNVHHLTIETGIVNSNRRRCAKENKCFGHGQSLPCIFF